MQIYEKILKHTKNLTFNNQNPSPHPPRNRLQCPPSPPVRQVA